MFRRIVVGISGGIDSAVAAHVLKSKRFDVIGVFMRNWDEIDEKTVCTGEQDWEHAQLVCHHLQIPLIQKSFVKSYWNDVFQEFIRDYEAGVTPNPDVLCNKYIKFDQFYRYAREELGADAIATGHYANSSFGPLLEHFDPNHNVKLLKAGDPFKDQTFFLSQISQEALQRTMFPLGAQTKAVVKQTAIEIGLEFLERKKESTGICFIGRRNFSDFISEYVNDKSGDFVDIDTGKVVGSHRGVHHWTVGQRCRLGGHLKPYFVAEKDVERSIIFIASGTDHPSLFSLELVIEPLHWIDPNNRVLVSGELECQFRFQHTKPLVKCKLIVDRENGNDSWIVILEKPLRSITPGQYAVFYLGDECLGSSRIINRTINCSEMQFSRGKII